MFRKNPTKTLLIDKKISNLFFILLFSWLSLAAITTIWSVYIKSFVGKEFLVGFITTSFALSVLVFYVFIVPLIEKYSKSKLHFITLVILLATSILFIINNNFIIFLIIALIFLFSKAAYILTQGLIVKDFSERKNLSRNEGFVFTGINIAWVIGPLIAGYLLYLYGFNSVFLLAAAFFLFSLILFKTSKIKDDNIKKKLDKNILKNTKDFFKNKQRIIIYFLTGGVEFWWVLIMIFMPLYIVKQGLPDVWIGYFIFATGIPLILFEFYFSNLAGKEGFKIMFKTGYFLTGIIAIVCFFISNPYIVLILLVFASCGIAMLEPTTEACFFDCIKKNQEQKYYPIYNTSLITGNLIATLFSSLILIFFPLKTLFLFFGFVMFLLFIASFKIKNIIESRRIN